MQVARTSNPSLAKILGLWVGPILFVAMLLMGQSQQAMPVDAWLVAAVGLWMAIWWMTEAIPVPVTALLPIVLFPLLGIAEIKDTTGSYAHPIIYLFLAVFYWRRRFKNGIFTDV